jgi:hypothetical protein
VKRLARDGPRDRPRGSSRQSRAHGRAPAFRGRRLYAFRAFERGGSQSMRKARRDRTCAAA